MFQILIIFSLPFNFQLKNYKLFENFKLKIEKLFLCPIITHTPNSLAKLFKLVI